MFSFLTYALALLLPLLTLQSDHSKLGVSLSLSLPSLCSVFFHPLLFYFSLCLSCSFYLLLYASLSLSFHLSLSMSVSIFLYIYSVQFVYYLSFFLCQGTVPLAGCQIALHESRPFGFTLSVTYTHTHCVCVCFSVSYPNTHTLSLM